MKYSLADNALSLTPNGCVAIISGTERTVALDEIIDFMISEGTGLTRPQAMAYFEKLTQTVEYFIGLGHRVVTPLFRVKPSISGIFINPDDLFDPARHKVNIRTSSGKRLMSWATKIKPEKVDVALPVPVLRSFFDGVNKKMNATAASDGYGTINGKRLKFDETDSRLGVFFIPETDPFEEISMLGYLEVRPSKLHFRIPILSPGSYRIIVRTLSRNALTVLQGDLKYKIIVE